MSATHESTISSSLLRGVFHAAECAGVTREALMTVAGVASHELDGVSPHLSLERYERVCAAAMQLTGDEAFGLRWAQCSLRRGFGPLADSLALAVSLRQALHLLACFEQFFVDCASHALLESPDEAIVRIHPQPYRSVAVRRMMAELGMAWYFRLLRAMRPEATPHRLDFTHDAPYYATDYARVFGPGVRFGQPSNELAFAGEWLDVPSSPSAHASADAPDDGQNRHVGMPGSYARRTFDLLIARAPTRLSMPQAAEMLGVGERSLRRRLAEEGRTFRQIEFAVLAQIATRYLCDQQRSVKDTAREMGFTGSIAFHRAFKRWTGTSPSDVQGAALRRSTER